MHWRRKWQPTPVFLPGESQGQGNLVGFRLWGHAESDTTEATWQQQSFQNDCQYCLCPQGELQLLPTSLGGSPSSAHGSYSDFFQMTASALSFGGCEILRVAFKTEVSIFHIPRVFERKPHWPQSQMTWGLLFLVQDPWAEEPKVQLQLLLRENLCNRVGCSSHTCLDHTVSLLLLPILLWFHLYL